MRRLAKVPDLLQRYSDIIDDQLTRGIIEKVPPDSTPSTKLHYIPHQPIFRDSKTTPIRIVFDCSCRSNSGSNSLNDCLESGPPLLNDITAMLMRFRLHRFGLVTDIEKAFLAICLDIDDRDVTRFLWPIDPFEPSSPFQEYRFLRVLFGATSSPFMLSSTVIQHLRNSTSPVASKILRDIYVDNIITSCKTESECVEFYKESRSVMSDGNFNLRGWSSNCATVTDVASVDNVYDNSHDVNVLGLRWCPDTDYLSFAPKTNQTAQFDTR